MRIAVVQMSPVRGRVSQNLERMDSILSSIAGEADVVLFPELVTSGYFFTKVADLQPLCEVCGEGSLSSLLRTHAVGEQMSVIAGYPEIDPTSGLIYNSSIAALADGTFRNYRKSHLFYRESEVFSEGNSGFFTFAVDGISFGMMICYDWRFPEAARALALLGAQVILHPSNLVSPRGVWRPAMRTRALENGVVVVTANRGGREEQEGETLQFTGGSLIIDPTGTVLSEAGEEDEVMILDVSPIRAREVNRHNDIWDDRRPELYSELTRKPEK